MPPPTSLSALSTTKLKKYFSFVHSSEASYASTSTPNPDSNISLVGPRPTTPPGKGKPSTVTVITLSSLSRHTSRELASLPLNPPTSLSRPASREHLRSSSSSHTHTHHGGQVVTAANLPFFRRRPSTRTPQPKGAPGGPRTSMSAARSSVGSAKRRSSSRPGSAGAGTRPGSGGRPGSSSGGENGGTSRPGSRQGTVSIGNGNAMGGAAPSAFKKFEGRTDPSGEAKPRPLPPRGGQAPPSQAPERDPRPSIDASSEDSHYQMHQHHRQGSEPQFNAPLFQPDSPLPHVLTHSPPSHVHSQGTDALHPSEDQDQEQDQASLAESLGLEYEDPLPASPSQLDVPSWDKGKARDLSPPSPLAPSPAPSSEASPVVQHLERHQRKASIPIAAPQLPVVFAEMDGFGLDLPVYVAAPPPTQHPTPAQAHNTPTHQPPTQVQQVQPTQKRPPRPLPRPLPSPPGMSSSFSSQPPTPLASASFPSSGAPTPTQNTFSPPPQPPVQPQPQPPSHPLPQPQPQTTGGGKVGETPTNATIPTTTATAAATSPTSPSSALTSRPTLRRKRKHPLPPTPASPPVASGWPQGQGHGQSASPTKIEGGKGEEVSQPSLPPTQSEAHVSTQGNTQTPIPPPPPSHTLHIPPPPSSPPPSPHIAPLLPSVPPPPPASSTQASPPTSTTTQPSNAPAPSTLSTTQAPMSSHRLLVHQHAQLQRQKQREQLHRLLLQESTGPLGLASGWTPRARTVSAGAAKLLSSAKAVKGEATGKGEGKTKQESLEEKKLMIGEPKRLRKASLPTTSSSAATVPPRASKMAQSVSASASIPAPTSTSRSRSDSARTCSPPAPTPPPKDRGPLASVSTSSTPSPIASPPSPATTIASSVSSRTTTTTTGSTPSKQRTTVTPVSPAPRSPRRFIPPPPRPPPRHQPLPPPPPGFEVVGTPMTAGPPPPGSGLSTPKVPPPPPAPPIQPLPAAQTQVSQPSSTPTSAHTSRLLPQATQSLPSTPSATGSTARSATTPSRFAHLQSLSNAPRANTMSTNAVGRVMSVQPPPPSRSMTQPPGGLLRSVTSVAGTRGPRLGASRPVNAPTAVGAGTMAQGPRARAPSFPRPLPPTGPIPASSPNPPPPPLLAPAPPSAPRPPPPRPIQVPHQPRADVELLNQEDTPPASAAPWTGVSVVPTPVPNSADVNWSDMVREMAVGLMVKDTPQAGSVPVSGVGGEAGGVVGARGGLGAPVQGKRRPLPPTPQSR